MSQEAGYLVLMHKIMQDGEERDGRNGKTWSLFGERLEFDLRMGFPLLTTKKVFWRGVVEELLWFLRGCTDAKLLADKKVHIWDGNTSRAFLDSVGLTDVPEGEIGAGYGYQWRCFGGNYPERAGGVDQVRYVLEQLTTNPMGRRAVLSAWNPKQLQRMALPPCHMLYEFYRGNEGLSCMMVMRSCDVGAGLPFNIASTSLLTSLFAHMLGVPVHKIVINMGDTHLYDVHLESAKEQIQREPYALPELVIQREPPLPESGVDGMLDWLETLTFEDLHLRGYSTHPPLQYPMVV
jgi:thymidylate synthase